ncbi:hypothetical protein ACVWYG_001502 [Pedobacter sp. UYEF25]
MKKVRKVRFFETPFGFSAEAKLNPASADKTMPFGSGQKNLHPPLRSKYYFFDSESCPSWPTLVFLASTKSQWRSVPEWAYKTVHVF